MPTLRREVKSPDGTLIPVYTSGTGRPLLIVHGATTDHGSWDDVRSHLESHVTVAAMHRRATSGDPSSPLDLTNEFADVATVAMSLGNEVDVLGHSSGALCALGASVQTTNLRRLVLYEPPWEEPSDHFAEVISRMNQLLAAGDIDGVFSTWLQDWVGMPEVVANDLKSSPIGEALLPFAKYLPREMAAHIAWAFVPERFTGLRAPTLYLEGSETPEGDLQLREYSRRLNGVIPNLTFRQIPGQGHMANFLAPDLLAEIILDFLNTDG